MYGKSLTISVSWVWHLVLTPKLHRCCSRDLFSLRLELHLKWYNIYTMSFDYDKRKSASNKTKHGINFEEAQALWEDRFILKIPSSMNTIEESRFLFIGRIDSKHWTAITTHRKTDLTRIISVRRSRKQEVELYES